MYYVVPIQPQVADTNLFGHIDDRSYMRWFDRARMPFYTELFPGFHLKPHGLAVVKATEEYFFEIDVDAKLEARVWVARIGNKSFDVVQELWRVLDGREECCATSRCVFSTINFDTHRSEPLTEHFLAVLRKYYDDREPTPAPKRDEIDV